jgi:hypothetical protein
MTDVITSGSAPASFGPGGFYFTTPNFNSLSRRCLGGRWVVIEYPEHLVYYTVSTVDRLLSGAGFSRQSVRTTGFSPESVRCSTGTGTMPGHADEGLRSEIEGRVFLRMARDIVNGLLNIFRAGYTLKGFYVGEPPKEIPSASYAVAKGSICREAD